MLLTLTVLAVLSHTGRAGPASRLRGLDAPFECAKTNHPDDCQFVGDLLNELKSQCGKGQRLVTDLRTDTDFCDYGRTVSCTPDKTRLAQVQIFMDPSATRANRNLGTFCATKDQSGYYNLEALPNGDKNFQLPKSYSKLTNLTSLHLDGVTNICDVQDAVVLPTLTTVYIRVQNANVQTKCPGGYGFYLILFFDILTHSLTLRFGFVPFLFSISVSSSPAPALPGTCIFQKFPIEPYIRWLRSASQTSTLPGNRSPPRLELSCADSSAPIVRCLARSHAASCPQWDVLTSHILTHQKTLGTKTLGATPKRTSARLKFVLSETLVTILSTMVKRISTLVST